MRRREQARNLLQRAELRGAEIEHERRLNDAASICIRGFVKRVIIASGTGPLQAEDPRSLTHP